MDDTRKQLKQDVEDLGSVEDLGKVEAFILDLKEKETSRPESDYEEHASRESQ